MAKAVGQFTIIDLNDITISSIAPAVKIVNMIWLDTSVVPNQLKKWSGTAWINIGDRNEDLEDTIDQKFTNYYTKTETTSAINQAKDSIDLSVDQKINQTTTTINTRTDEVLESYSTTNEMNSAISLSAQSIELSVSQKIKSTYRQSYEPSQPKEGEFWYRTTDGKMLRFNGVIWELVEDGAISQINSEIASLTISTSDIISRVEDAEDNVSLAVQTIDTFSSRIQSIEANMNFEYMQDTPPEDPKIGDVWFNTNPEGFIVDLLTLTVDEMTQQVDYYGQTLNKSYRWDGTDWKHVEDGAITELRQSVSAFEQTVNSISATVSAYDGRIGTLELTSNSLTSRISTTEGNISTIVQTATNLTSRISTAEGNISTVTQTANSLTSRISNAEGNISTVTQTANSLTSRISNAEGDISTIQQTASGITAAVNAAKLEFNSSGLTIKNGGFKIMAGTSTLLSSDGGNIKITGGFTSGYATMNSQGVWLSPYIYNWSGSPSGGRLYFDTGSNVLKMTAMGWAISLQTSGAEYKQHYYYSGYRHTFTGGDVYITGNLYVNDKKIN